MPCWGQDTDKTTLASQVSVRTVEIPLDKSILGDMSPDSHSGLAVAFTGWLLQTPYLALVGFQAGDGRDLSL